MNTKSPPWPIFKVVILVVVGSAMVAYTLTRSQRNPDADGIPSNTVDEEYRMSELRDENLDNKVEPATPNELIIGSLRIPIDTIGWSEYRQDGYGISFLYPDSIRIVDTLQTIELQDTHGALLLSVTKPVAIESYEGYPEAWQYFVDEVARSTTNRGDLSMSLASGRTPSGQRRLYAMIRSRVFAAEVMTLVDSGEYERSLFAGVVSTLNLTE